MEVSLYNFFYLTLSCSFLGVVGTQPGALGGGIFNKPLGAGGLGTGIGGGVC